MLVTTDAPARLVTDDSHDDETPGPERPDGPRTVPAGAFVFAVLVAAALGALALAALLIDSDSGDADETAIRLAAGRFTETFLTIGHDDVEGWKDRVLELSTGAFAESVDDVEAGLRQLTAANEIDATAEATEIFVGVVDRGSVDVVVIYDRVVDGADGRRSETDRYLQLSMVRADGLWLVDNVIDIATAGAIGSPMSDTGG